MTKFDIDFEEWYIKRYLNNGVSKKVRAFYNYPIEMQFGVYQLFADSLNVSVDVYLAQLNYKFYIILGNPIKDITTRTEAMQEAVKQFKYWYNNQ